MKTLLVIIVFMAVVLSVNTTEVFATDVRIILKEGCDKFENPDSFLDKDWIEASKKGGMYEGGYKTSFCETTDKMLTLKYGAVESVFSNNRLGIGQNVRYTYQTFCFTLGKLHERLEGDRRGMQKLLFFLAIPAIRESGSFASVSYITYNTSGTISPFTLMDLDINFYGDRFPRPDDYRKFFQYLFTGDLDGAESIIRDVPEEFLNRMHDICIKEGQR